jgi:hypothetical protein
MMVRAGKSKCPGRFSMALTFQRTLELAGTLSKVRPQLERLHLVEKPQPKKRHLRRNVVLVGGTIAVGALVAGVVWRRRGCRNGAAAGNGGDGQAEQKPPDAEPDSEGLTAEADGARDIEAAASA